MRKSTFFNFIIFYMLAFALLPTLQATSADNLQFTFIGSYPSDRELSGEGADSEEAQGIAFSGTHWYYSNKLARTTQN